MLRFASLQKLVIAGSLVLATAACNIGGIGDGNKPDSVEIVRVTGLLDRTTNKSYVCFTDRLQLIGRFTDGQVGDYTNRNATWTSSNPSVLQVSNGDIPLPSQADLFFPRGTLIPRSAGTAVISVDYVGLKTSYEVEVRTPEAFEIQTPQLVIAPNTLGGLVLAATIDGRELDVTPAAAWSFVQDAEFTDDFATIGATTGVVAARGETTGVTLTARATLELCPELEGIDNLTANVVVSEIQSIAITREFADAPDNELVRNTTDLLTVTATLASGDTQNLTAQQSITYASDATTIAIPGAAGVRNLVSGLAVGTANITATWTGVDPDPENDDIDPPTLPSAPLPLTIVEDTISALEVTPAGATIRVGGRVQFAAEATYTAVPTRKQGVTRHIAWTSSDTDEVALSTNGFSGGLAGSVNDEPTTAPVEITATATISGSGDTAVTVTKKVLVCVIAADAPASPLPAGCPPLVDEDDDEEPAP